MSPDISIPLFSFHLSDTVSIESYGKALHYEPNETDLSTQRELIEDLARRAGASRVTWQRLTNLHTHPHRRYAIEARRDETEYLHMPGERADGFILHHPGEAVAIATRDCPALTLFSTRGGPVAVLHCARDTLHGIDQGNVEKSVVIDAIRQCIYEWEDMESVHGFITLGIAPQHFPNDRYPKIVEKLKDTWGEHVIHDVARGTIDLVELITRQLETYGVARSRVSHDGLCTYSDSRLASHRRGHGGCHNLILVIKRG